MPSGMIKIDVTPSQMRAFMTVSASPASATEAAPAFPTVDEILSELRTQNITFGIIPEALETLVQARQSDSRTLVAKGVEALHGEDGSVDYLFDASGRPQPRQNQDGTVDYHEIGLIHSVEKDQVLARVLPPQNGIPGTNVRGEEVPARAGTPAFIQAGQNTYFADVRKLELRAQVAGSVTLVHGIINVDQTYTIRGDVDYATGNVHFPGNVVIQGDVKTGFKVQAGGKVEIRGIVEDALVEAQGDILVKGGFEGSGRGLIRSAGTVHLKFVENQVVEAEGSVYVGEDVLSARVTSGGGVFLTTGIGTIIGGLVRAQSGITAKVLGNTHATPTRVEIVQKEISETEVQQQEQNVQHLQTEIAGLAPVIATLKRRKIADPAYAPEIEVELESLSQKLQQLRTDQEKAQGDLQSLKTAVEKAKTSGKIHVLSRIYPGVEVSVCGLHHYFEAPGGKTIIKKSGLELVVDQMDHVGAET